ILPRLGLPPRPVMSLHQSLAVDAPITQLFAALTGDAVLRLLGRERSLDAERFAEECGRRPVDLLKIAPSHLAALAEAARPADALPRHMMMLGGEALLWPFVEQVRALGGAAGMLNHYGPTETTVGVLTQLVWPERPAAAGAAAGAAPLAAPHRPGAGSVP